jgi:hypothetical protein
MKMSEHAHAKSVGSEIMGRIQSSARLAAFLLSVVSFASLCGSHAAFAQAQERGTIAGNVTADQGEVHGFRVRAHNLDRMIWYTVFTKSG